MSFVRIPGEKTTVWSASPSSSDALNLLCPRSDALFTVLPLFESSGSPGDIGSGDIYQTDGTNFGSALTGAVLSNALARASEAGIGNIYDLDGSTTDHVRLWRNAGSTSYTLSEWGFLFLIKWGSDNWPGNNVPIMHNNLDSSSDEGALRIFINQSGASIRSNITGSGGSNSNVNLTSVFPASEVWMPIFISGGPKYGRRMYAVTYANSVADATANCDIIFPARFGAGAASDGVFLIGAAADPELVAPASSEDLKFGGFAAWNCELLPSQIEKIMADPMLPWRTNPNEELADQLNIINNPVISRMKTTAISMSGGTKQVTGGGAGWRVYIKTAAATSWPGSPTVTLTKTADFTRAVAEATGLTAGSDYEAYAEHTTDNGTTWRVSAGGPMRFRTARASSDTDFHFGCVSDCHCGGNNGYTITTPRFTKSDRRRNLAVDRVSQCILEYEDWDFGVHVGDFAMTDGNWSNDGTLTTIGNDPGVFNSYRKAFWAWNDVWSMMNFELLLGNHEAECGYLQWLNKNEIGALQAFSTKARKQSFALPDNSTYAEGGENEGAVGNPSAPNVLDWLPPFGSQSSGTGSAQTFGSAYHTDYVVDSDGINESPLENYWAREHGDCLFVYLDINRYTKPGDPDESGIVGSSGVGGTHHRPSSEWTLGGTQMAWLTTTLKNSSASWKFVFLHNLMGEQIAVTGRSKSTDANYGDEASGAGRYYGRGSGLFDDSTEQETLLNLLATYGVTAVIKGHDHKACHVVRTDYGGLNIITCPNGGAPNLTEGDGSNGGWNWENIADSFGTMETGHLGAGNILDWDGNTMSSDLKYSENVIGYVRFEVTSSTVTVKFIRAEISRNPTSSGDETPTQAWKGLERNPGTLFDDAANTDTTTTVSGYTEFDDAIDVAHVGLFSDQTSSQWWDAYEAESNFGNFDDRLGGRSIGNASKLDNSGTNVVDVTHTPMGGLDRRIRLLPELTYSATLSNAVLASGPGILTVTPGTALSSSGDVGGPFSPSSRVYTLTNDGDSSLDWTAAKTQSWVTLSSSSGTLASGASTTVTVSVNSGADSLVAGVYNDTVTFTNTTDGTGDTTRTVELTVSDAGANKGLSAGKTRMVTGIQRVPVRGQPRQESAKNVFRT